MKLTTRYKSVICTLVVTLAVLPTVALTKSNESDRDIVRAGATAHLLDGMKFKGPTGEIGKNDHHVDILSFEKGKFTSSECFQFGFKGGPYTTSVEAGVIHFKAETISPSHGKMEWSGTLKGDTLEVEYSWTKERWLWTTYREYWFKGKLIE